MAEPANTPPVGERRRPGMDHSHHAYRTLTEAPRFTWPDDARIAFTVTLVLDYWEVNPPEEASRDPRIVSPLGNFFPDWLTWSQREYGARVGIFRVLDVLDRFGVTPSVALGAAAAKRYPELVDELVRRNACFMAHGTYATRRITSRMSEAEERAFIAESRDAVHAAAGRGAAGLVRSGLQRVGSHARAAGRGRLHLHDRLGKRRSAFPAGPRACCAAAAAGVERPGVHVAAPRAAAGLGGQCRRGVRLPARRRRRVLQPDAASVDRRPGAPHSLSA